MKAENIYKKLRGLLNQCGPVYYQRIRLAHQLLRDRLWVKSPEGGGGDESKAIDRLEAHCFADLCGLIGLPQLLEIYHTIPDVRVWERNHFNFRRMISELHRMKRPVPKKKPVAAERNREVGTSRPTYHPPQRPSNLQEAYQRLVQEYNEVVKERDSLLRAMRRRTA